MYFEYGAYLKENRTYMGMFESMKEEIALFMDNFKDDPRFVSAWGHGYFCNEDGGRLIYDITKPFEHRCSICGRVYRGYQYDTCYVTMLRNEAIVTAVKSALLYSIFGEGKYLGITKDIINFYADNYENFCIHAKGKLNCSPVEDVGGAGRIMPQGLNEAIVAIRIVNAMELIKDSVDAAWIQEVKEKLFCPVFELLRPQKMHIHNIPTWINSAIGVMGFFFREQEWIDEAVKQPFNLFEQLDKGVTDSGFWYEGSIHYNFFALEGVMNFFVFARAYDYEIPQRSGEIVYRMFEAAYRYAFDNDIFPNPSDGWPNISLKTYSYVYYMAYKVFGSRVLKFLKHIEDDGLTRARLPLSEPYYYENRIPLERLLFAPDIDHLACEPAVRRVSESFEGSNCAILRNDTFNLFFKYGHQTRSHAHPDKMNVEIMVKDKVLTKDLSNSGYASRMCNLWHRRIAAHNTCIVNGKETDIQCMGRLLEYSDNHVKAEAQAYEGVVYERSLGLFGSRIEDSFTVKCEEEAVIDWLFHFETEVDRQGLTLLRDGEEEGLFSEHGAVMEVHRVDTKGLETLTISNELVDMELYLEPGARVYLAKTYNNPSDRLRDTVLIRKQGKQAVFAETIRAK